MKIILMTLVLLRFQKNKMSDVKTLPTMKDVANEANVSIKTVSRVINKEPNVSMKTAAKIEKVIQRLDYQPNAFAQSLARSTPKIISLIYDTPSPNYISHIMEGVLSFCYGAGYEVIIHPLKFNEPGFLDRTEHFIKKSRLAGLIITPPYSDHKPFIDLIERFNLPKILVSSGLNIAKKDLIKTNDEEAAFEMTNFLLSQGHKRIAFIKGHIAHLCVNDRFRGYTKAMTSHGMKIDESLIQNGTNSLSSGVQCAENLLSQSERPSAIFASNDEMAAGVINVAYKKGLRIPKDLSIVGFDDSPMTQMITPPLTTIRQPLDLIGRKSAEKLIDRLEGKDYDTISVINSEIIVRDSVADLN